MSLPQSLHRSIVLFCSIVLTWLCFVPAAASDAAELTATFGIDGHYRTGHWALLRIEGLGEGQAALVQTIDGDGVRMTQRVESPKARERDPSAHDSALITYLPAPPQGAPLSVTALDPRGEAAPGMQWQTRLNSSGAGGAVAARRPWILAIGDALGLEQVGRSELLGLGGSMDVSTVSAAGQLPDAWIGYDGVDLVVVSGSSTEILAELSNSQMVALAEWLQAGGRVLVTLGRRGPELLAAAPWLAAAIGGADSPQVVQVGPGAVERFISARGGEPLTAFPATRLSPQGKAILLSDAGQIPLAWQHRWGFGLSTVFAGGLDEEPAGAWPQRPELLKRILPGVFPDRQQRDQRRRSDLRYGELAGQVRATLDQFAGAGRARFSVIAAMILALVGLIGPLDYFLINRWLGRPLLGWITFPLTILAFSAAILVWRGGEGRSHVRQISIVDIDPASGIGRGFSWAQVFSAKADRIDLNLVSQPHCHAATDDVGATITGPWGYAGDVFGGIQVAGEDVRLPAYGLVLDERADANGDDHIDGDRGRSVASRLVDVPFAPLSSKGVVAQWHFPVAMEVRSGLRRRLGSDLLSGALVNPLDVDLIEGYLIYRNLVYLLPTRVPAGGTLAAVEVLQAKNFRWRLNRRQTGELSSASEPWDPADDSSLSRLMEVVLFYQAAGGASYVDLENRTLSSLDLSGALDADRAILVGRVRGNGAQVVVDGRPADPAGVEGETYVRIMLPIDSQEPTEQESER